MHQAFGVLFLLVVPALRAVGDAGSMNPILKLGGWSIGRQMLLLNDAITCAALRAASPPKPLRPVSTSG